MCSSYISTNLIFVVVGFGYKRRKVVKLAVNSFHHDNFNFFICTKMCINAETIAKNDFSKKKCRECLIYLSFAFKMFSLFLSPDMPDFGLLSSKTVTEVLMLEMKMSPNAKTYLVSGYPRNMRDVVEYSEKVRLYLSYICNNNIANILPKFLNTVELKEISFHACVLLTLETVGSH